MKTIVAILTLCIITPAMAQPCTSEDIKVFEMAYGSPGRIIHDPRFPDRPMRLVSVRLVGGKCVVVLDRAD